MREDPAARRAERAERATYHFEAEQRRRQQEAAQAQVLVGEFVRRAREAGIPPEELTARPWSGSGRYRTGVDGWYLRRDRSVAVGVDGGYYVLVVAPRRLGRWRKVTLQPEPPPLQVGRGGRDGESVGLAELLEARLGQPDTRA